MNGAMRKLASRFSGAFPGTPGRGKIDSDLRPSLTSGVRVFSQVTVVRIRNAMRDGDYIDEGASALH